MQLAPHADKATKPGVGEGHFGNSRSPDDFACLLQSKKVAVSRRNACQPLSGRQGLRSAVYSLGIVPLCPFVARLVIHVQALGKSVNFGQQVGSVSGLGEVALGSLAQTPQPVAGQFFAGTQKNR